MRRSMVMRSRATDRRSASKWQGKWPDQTLGQALGLPEVLVAVGTSRLSCKRAGKTRTLMPLWDSSGESRFLHLAAGAAALPFAPHVARAQAYPSRPVRIIVPGAAGNTTDLLARLLGQWLSERLGQPFVIENRPGAGTNIGTEAVVRAAADGHTLLLIAAGNVISPSLYEKLNFDFTRDIAPVASIFRVPNVLVVNPSFPAKTVPEFIAYARANPGKINFASPGV